MQRRQIQLIQELLEESLYEVDAQAVAGAILARAATRRTVPGTTFRNDLRDEAPQVRSFRPTRQARSFRPCGGTASGEESVAGAPRGRR
jgi:hypothetical protein